ncbi:MAG TPA: CpaF family protein [Thermoleophilaceae bacterium]
MEALDELALALRARLVERVRSGEADEGSLGEQVRALVEREAAPLPEAERAALCERVVVLATGLGPLDPLLADPEVDEVMVNGPGEVYVERRGRLERAAASFGSEAELLHAIERILAPLGRRVDEASPLCDARLADGSRVNVVIGPLSLSGPCLTVRRFRQEGFSLRDLVVGGTLATTAAELLALCVAARASILVSGGTGSGKTTTLGALSSFIPDDERIVTIEDAAELRLRQRHVVRLEARPPNLEGRGEVTIRTLVRNALRMRPDRIVVGEVRGPEALDMLQALNTGHDGSLTTVHANSPQDAVRRVETLALMAGVGLPHAAVREQVASALDLVVHQTRRADGARVVESIVEVVRVAGGAGVRELYCHGGAVAAPGESALGRRLAAFRAVGARSVSAGGLTMGSIAEDRC